MKYAIRLLPTLLAIGFVAALSTQSQPLAIDPPSPDRTAEIRHLHQAMAQMSARLAALEAAPHHFLPRGASAESRALVATNSVASSAAGVRQP